MRSKQKNIYILFIHCSFNPAELSKTRPVDPAKDQMEIIIGPRTMLRFINTFNPITLEDKLASFKTNESMKQVDSLKQPVSDLPDELEQINRMATEEQSSD